MLFSTAIAVPASRVVLPLPSCATAPLTVMASSAVIVRSPAAPLFWTLPAFVPSLSMTTAPRTAAPSVLASITRSPPVVTTSPATVTLPPLRAIPCIAETFSPAATLMSPPVPLAVTVTVESLELTVPRTTDFAVTSIESPALAATLPAKTLSVFWRSILPTTLFAVSVRVLPSAVVNLVSMSMLPPMMLLAVIEASPFTSSSLAVPVLTTLPLFDSKELALAAFSALTTPANTRFCGSTAVVSTVTSSLSAVISPRVSPVVFLTVTSPTCLVLSAFFTVPILLAPLRSKFWRSVVSPSLASTRLSAVMTPAAAWAVSAQSFTSPPAAERSPLRLIAVTLSEIAASRLASAPRWMPSPPSAVPFLTARCLPESTVMEPPPVASQMSITLRASRLSP